MSVSRQADDCDQSVASSWWRSTCWVRQQKGKSTTTTERRGEDVQGVTKTSLKFFLPFSEQPLGIVTRNVTQLFPVHTRVKLPNSVSFIIFSYDKDINFPVTTSSFLMFICSWMFVKRKVYDVFAAKKTHCHSKKIRTTWHWLWEIQVFI